MDGGDIVMIHRRVDELGDTRSGWRTNKVASQDGPHARGESRIKGLSTTPRAKPSKSPGAGPSKSPGAGPSKSHSANPSKSPGADPSKNPRASSGRSAN